MTTETVVTGAPSGAPAAGSANAGGTPPASGDKPADAGKTIVTSDKPADKPADAPADAPADKPGDKPGDKPADQPGDKPADKPSDKPGDPPVVPDKYDLKVPEGVTLPADVLERTTATAKALGLTTNEQAQALLDHTSAVVAQHHETLIGEHVTRVAGWVDELKADKEYGGHAFVKTAEAAHRAFLKFGSPALKEALDASGYGNHPEFVRMMSRIGRALGEDKIESGNSGGSPAGKEITAADMYPSMKKP